MSNIAIKAENLSKAYQLGEIGTGTISRDLERWYARIRGKEDPFLRIGETNDRTSKGSSDIVWSLKDINFEIEQGDAVGIIGRNGAGKSTLLKVLSRVTSPTTGRITGKGRIASLLEVGTGFHPELTGRENIYLNGTILGMRKKEITRKFDEIVAFAGVERYIDTPVKRYSSGMYVRLAFAVAAHLESEILIVDEVLAVGDAEFQKKCLGKMQDVSKGEGRTVLFVSHNMGMISQLCEKCIFLKNGEVKKIGLTADIINYYSETHTDSNIALSEIKFNGPIRDKFKLTDLVINNQSIQKVEVIVSSNEEILFEVVYKLSEEMDYQLTFSIFCDGIRLFTLHDLSEPTKNDNSLGIVKSTFKIPSHALRPGIFQIGIGGYENGNMAFWFWNESVYSFNVLEKYSDIIDSRNEGKINILAETSRQYV